MGNLQGKPQQTSENPREIVREEEEASTTFTCEICYEPMLSNNNFKNNSRCIHPFCKECIAKYIQVKVEDGVANIKCPGLNCNQLLDPISCTPIIAHQVFDKWCDNLCESALLGFDSRCYCPNRDCSVLVVNECGGTVSKEKCPNCKKLFCFKCKIAWHAGYRCEESGQLRDRNDVLFGQLLERNKWVRCPQCGHCVELRSGCSVVRCRCKTHFCYTCGEPFNMGSCGCNHHGAVLCHNMIMMFIYMIFVFLMLYLLFTYMIHYNHINDSYAPAT